MCIIVKYTYKNTHIYANIHVNMYHCEAAHSACTCVCVCARIWFSRGVSCVCVCGCNSPFAAALNSMTLGSTAARSTRALPEDLPQELDFVAWREKCADFAAHT